MSSSITALSAVRRDQGNGGDKLSVVWNFLAPGLVLLAGALMEFSPFLQRTVEFEAPSKCTASAAGGENQCAVALFDDFVRKTGRLFRSMWRYMPKV
jgi:hypothetical protein